MRPPPGGTRSEAEHAALVDAVAAMSAGYEPRTHLMESGRPVFVNRLIRETSPYLLQHAHNPVDWWPWGEAALAEAARRDLPLFLSAGYATCHWCHVMEEESFDTVAVAEVLNAGFVAVKLDREERPDIDHFYILATTLQNRQAGWPNSIWALPDGRPFHTGTYFRQGHFLQLCRAVSQGWTGGQRAEFERFAGELTGAVRRIGMRSGSGEAAALAEVPARAVAQLAGMYNRAEGGFSETMQFPHEGYLLFLIDRWHRSGDAAALEMAAGTLDAIAAGGIHDHVGGGFHRYTVDVNWRTPHFEKMLYNQSLLMQSYISLWELTGAEAHARAARRCADYVLRDMTDADGAFFAAEDADSPDAQGRREEGVFYAWPPDAARAALGEDGDWAVTVLGLDQPATIEAGPVAHLRPGAAVDFARLNAVLERMRTARDARARPIRDEKVIAGWNGLMIRALADAGRVLGEPMLVDAAARAAEAVLARLETADGLMRIHAGGRAAKPANLTDLAWLGLGFVALADAGARAGDGSGWLERAEALATRILGGFATAEGRLALVRDEPALGTVLENEDGATPSGEASALELMAMLEERAPDPERRSRAGAVVAASAGQTAEMPVARLTALAAATALAEGGAGWLRHAGGGAVRLQMRRSGAGLVLEIAIAEGWHLAASDREGLQPLALEGAETTLPAPVDWPSPLGGSLPALVGTLRLALAPTAQVVTVTLQPCAADRCALPETVRFRVMP